MASYNECFLEAAWPDGWTEPIWSSAAFGRALLLGATLQGPAGPYERRLGMPTHEAILGQLAVDLPQSCVHLASGRRATPDAICDNTRFPRLCTQQALRPALDALVSIGCAPVQRHRPQVSVFDDGSLRVCQPVALSQQAHDDESAPRWEPAVCTLRCAQGHVGLSLVFENRSTKERATRTTAGNVAEASTHPLPDAAAPADTADPAARTNHTRCTFHGTVGTAVAVPSKAARRSQPACSPVAACNGRWVVCAAATVAAMAASTSHVAANLYHRDEMATAHAMDSVHESPHGHATEDGSGTRARQTAHAEKMTNQASAKVALGGS